MPYPKTHEKVIELVKDFDRDIKIVDLGCGRCVIVKELQKLGFKNLSYCDKGNFDKVKVMDFNKRLDFKNNSFDLVICTEVIHYLENKFFFFKEVRRILKPSGIFIFSVPNLGNVFNRIYYLFKDVFIDRHSNFINPFFMWQIPDSFKIDKITYNRGFIPVLRIPFIKNKLFGQTVIVQLIKG